MTDEKRPYRKHRRAESEAQTRLRITESAIELHGTLGPARTSISAIAEHAGVRRSTVYRHFADETTLFDACSSLWMSRNPPPDPAEWATIENPRTRVRTALSNLYAYYGATERMLENLHRDEATVPAVKDRFRVFRDYLEAVAQVLVPRKQPAGAGRARLMAAIGHALSYSTWRSLVREQRLSDDDAVELMVQLVFAAARPAPTRARRRISSARSGR